MAAMALPRVGYAVSADRGANCSEDPHPRHKAHVADRLAAVVLRLVYDVSVEWRSPSYASAIARRTAEYVTVEVSLRM